MAEQRAIGRFEPDDLVRRQLSGEDEAHARLRNVLESAGNDLVFVTETDDFNVQIGQSAVM